MTFPGMIETIGDVTETHLAVAATATGAPARSRAGGGPGGGPAKGAGSGPAKGAGGGPAKGAGSGPAKGAGGGPVDRGARARRPGRERGRWRVPAVLLALSAIPLAAGAVRLAQLIGGAAVTPENERFFDMPVPVVLHIVGIFG